MSPAKRRAAQISLISIGAIMIVFGILGGDLIVVLRKAINICLECIGIG